MKPPIVLVEALPDAESSTPPAAPGSDVDVLARTLWGEARGETVRGIEAVAAVIINRAALAQARGKYWWGNSVIEVCRKPWQFSCWNDNDPNRAKLEAVTAQDRRFRICLRIARRAINGGLTDLTGGACHYHTLSTLPPWARGRKASAQIGNHLFYAGIE